MLPESVVEVGMLIGPSSPPNSFSQLNNPNAKIATNSFFINSNLMLKKLFVRCLFLLDFGFVTFGNKSMVAQIHHLLPTLFLLSEVYVKELYPIHLYYFQRCLGNPEILLLIFYLQLYCKLC